MSTSSSKQTSVTGADSPLDLLRSWAAGGTPEGAENKEPDLLPEQKVRLWKLLSSPSKPGTIISSQSPR